MKKSNASAWLALITLGVLASLQPYRVAGQGAAGAEVLTNESVVQMVVGKLPKDVVLSKIQSTSTAFDITANGLVSLFQRKVPTDVMKAMMLASASNPNSKELLENSAILFMVTNKLPRDIIVAKIQSGKPGYDLTTAGLVSLNQNKVPQPVLKAMMASAASAPSTAAAPTSAATPAQSAAAPAAKTPAPAPAQTTPAPAAVSPPTNAGQTTAPAAKGSTKGATKDTTTKDTKAAPEKKK
jgi:hypothetical protein